MARQALGKGLDALLRQTQEVTAPAQTAAAAGASVQKISLDKIIPNRYQPRRIFDEEKLQELAASIKEHGLTQPIVVVYDAGMDKYEIVVGERRFRACQLAGLKEIDAIVHKALSNQQMCALALIENIQREDLNPIETALGYRNLMSQFEISQTDLAKYCGKSKAAVSNALRLLELPEHMQEALQDGKITEGHGRALLMLNDPTKREVLFARLLKNKLSVRQAEEAARALVRPMAEKLPKPPEVVSFEQDLQAALGTKVEVRYGRKMSKGMLIVHYHTLEELDNLASRLKTKLL
ncbi:MAG: ParB/RepB/Spo0J family partition protein [Elusimicrobiaceae bacterium]|nr:ParB/RepB/Spo0J family partition protein [Elusimicrobiaceae bacterium]